MSINHVLAVVPVADLAIAAPWYERLFGVAPTNIPMPGILAEWRLTDSGWVQIFVDEQRAGNGTFNLAVEPLQEHLTELRERGIEVAEMVNANKGVQTVELVDPFGNRVNLISGFRESY